MRQIEVFKKGRGCNLYYNGYFYNKPKLQPKVFFWLCTETECGTRLTSNFEMDTLMTHPSSHVHMPDNNRYKDLTLKTKTLSEMSQNPLKSISQIYKKIVAGTIDISLSSFRNVKSALYRQRYRMMPKMPWSSESLRVRDERAEKQDEKKICWKSTEVGVLSFLKRLAIESAFEM